MAGTASPLIEVVDLEKDYPTGAGVFQALRGVSLGIAEGEFVAIMGASGSGKSTFMNLLGCLDRPTRGVYRLSGQEVSSLSSDQLAALRNREIGFVFQGFNLLPKLSALDNVALPLLYAGMGRDARRHQAQAMLERVGLGERSHHTPLQLSGGQQQRVAIARALIADPTLIVADEPTGDLDRATGEEILGLLERLNDELDKTIVMVTHDPKAAEKAHRLVHLEKGVLVE